MSVGLSPVVGWDLGTTTTITKTGCGRAITISPTKLKPPRPRTQTPNTTQPQVVVVDSINLRRAHFTEFWSFASAMGFKAYVAELPNDVQVRPGWLFCGCMYGCKRTVKFEWVGLWEIEDN